MMNTVSGRNDQRNSEATITKLYSEALSPNNNNNNNNNLFSFELHDIRVFVFFKIDEKKRESLHSYL